MKRRTEVSPVDPFPPIPIGNSKQQQAEEMAPDDTPSRISVRGNKVFVRCAACGLEMDWESAAVAGLGEAMCIKCDAPLDPQHRIANWIHDREQGAVASKPAVSVPAPSEPSAPSVGEPSAAVHVEGMRVSVTYGERLFSPHEYHSFRIGPFTLSAEFKPEQDTLALARSLSETLEAFAEEQFQRALKSYREQMTAVAKEFNRP
jgi:hypothetical protein